MKCHNCGKNRSMSDFLKENFNAVWTNYIFQSYKGKKFGSGDAEPKKEVKKSVDYMSNDSLITNHLTPINEFHRLHPARRYIESRKIPQSAWGDIFYCTSFRSFVKEANETFGVQYDLNKMSNDDRLVFILRDKDKNIVGCQSRIFGGQDSKLRYITLMFRPFAPKIYGLDKIDTSKRVHVIEGIFDSMFIPNSLASCGSDLVNETTRALKDVVYVFDNEPRNLEICKKIKSAINAGHQVVIWGYDSKYKDINAMIEAGMTQDEILRHIEARTYRGPNASMAFMKWCKIPV